MPSIPWTPNRRLLCLSTAQIADALVITVGTVRNHLKRIYGKLDAHGRLEAVARAGIAPRVSVPSPPLLRAPASIMSYPHIPFGTRQLSHAASSIWLTKSR